MIIESRNNDFCFSFSRQTRQSHENDSVRYPLLTIYQFAKIFIGCRQYGRILVGKFQYFIVGYPCIPFDNVDY